MADYSDIIKNIGEIPDYISNEELRKVINIGIHDAIMHSNIIQSKSSVVFNITVYKHNEEGNRLLNCKVLFNASTPDTYTYNPKESIVSEENKKINHPKLRRTTVEPLNQSKIVNIDINIEV